MTYSRKPGPPCEKCGRQPTSRTSRKALDCDVCIEYRRKKSRDYYKRKREADAAAGNCLHCHKLNANGKNQCDDCLLKQRERSSKLQRKRVCNWCREPITRDRRVCDDCKEKKRLHHLKARKALRDTIFTRYGGKANGGYVCGCCGEIDDRVLTLDHINSDGAKHRKELKGEGNRNLYWWLRENNYPDGFQVLCYNCNISHFRHQRCVHFDGVPEAAILWLTGGRKRFGPKPPKGKHVHPLVNKSCEFDEVVTSADIAA